MSDQSIVFLLISTALILFIWGRIRYDLVAFIALISGAVVGVIPTQNVFSGFGHPAVVIIALVLIISRGLVRSGLHGQLHHKLQVKNRRIYQVNNITF